LDDDLDVDENQEAAKQNRTARANGPKYKSGSLSKRTFYANNPTLSWSNS